MINYITDQGGQRFPLAPKYVGTLSIPNNVIRYEAPAKLTETTSNNSGGLHTNTFGTTMVSHTFADGVGTIEFEDDVTSIGNNAFYNCSGLTSVTIPGSVTTIGDGVFNDCSGLTSIIIPNSVTSIGNGAFAGCTSLTNVTISNNVTSIGNQTFAVCSGLTTITIPDNVTTIDSQAFQDCSALTSVTISDSVTNIGGGAFYNCTNLTSVTVKATIPPTLDGIQIFDNTNNCPIYVPAESVDIYKAASVWSSYASRIQAIPTV